MGILADIEQARIDCEIPAHGKRSHAWFKKTVRKLGAGATATKLFKQSPELMRSRGGVKFIGNMLLYRYVPKFKDVLPVWDEFPLVFIFGKHPGGWTGINLHYGPAQVRLDLIESIIRAGNQQTANRIPLQYGAIRRFGTSRFVKGNMVKTYLTSHMRSNFMVIPVDDWISAALLPTWKFRKQSATTVWGQTNKAGRKR